MLLRPIEGDLKVSGAHDKAILLTQPVPELIEKLQISAIGKWIEGCDAAGKRPRVRRIDHYRFTKIVPDQLLAVGAQGQHIILDPLAPDLRPHITSIRQGALGRVVVVADILQLHLQTEKTEFGQ